MSSDAVRIRSKNRKNKKEKETDENTVLPSAVGALTSCVKSRTDMNPTWIWGGLKIEKGGSGDGPISFFYRANAP